MIDLSQSNRLNILNRWLSIKGLPAVAAGGFCHGDAQMWALYKLLNKGEKIESTTAKVASLSGYEIAEFERQHDEYLAYLAYQKAKSTADEFEISKRSKALPKDLNDYNSEYIEKLKIAHEKFIEVFSYYENTMAIYTPGLFMYQGEAPNQNEIDRTLNFIRNNIVLQDTLDQTKDLKIGPDDELLEEQFKFAQLYRNVEELEYVLFELSKALKTNKMLVLRTNNHTFSAFYDSDKNQFTFYDPNDKNGAKKCASIGVLAKYLFENQLSDRKNILPIAIHVVDYKKNELEKPNTTKLIEKIDSIRNGLEPEISEEEKFKSLWYNIWICAVRNDIESLNLCLNEIGEDLKQKLLSTTLYDLNGPLRATSENNEVDVAKVLIKNGAPLDSYEIYTYSPLIQAAFNGVNDVAKILIENGANVNATMPRTGETPLLIAVKKNNLTLVKMLLENKADPSIFSCLREDRTFPLKAAINKKNIDICLALVFKDNILNELQFNYLNQDLKFELLLLAAKFGKADIVMAILKQEPNLANLRFIANNRDLLKTLIDNDEFDLFKRLAEENYIKLNQSSCDYYPLRYAAFKGKDKFVAYCLENGSDVNQKSSNEETALTSAASSGNISVVKQILDQNPEIDYLKLLTSAIEKPDVINFLLANINFPQEHMVKLLPKVINSKNLVLVKKCIQLCNHQELSKLQQYELFSLLQWACEQNDAKLVQEFLVLTTDLSEYQLNNLIKSAIKTNNVEMVQLILSCAQANIIDKNQIANEFLLMAASVGANDIVDLLTRNLFKIEKLSGKDISQMNEAILNGHKDLIIKLLETGINLNTPMDYGVLPLYSAVESKNKDLVEIFIKHKASPEKATDSNNKTALTKALDNESLDIIKILIFGLDGTDYNGIKALNQDQLNTLFRLLIDKNEYAIILQISEVLPDLFSDKTTISLWNQSLVFKDIDFVKKLVECNLIVPDKVMNLNHPLNEALRKGNEETAHYLIDQGANVNDEKNISTPLHHAVRFTKDVEILKKMVAKGVDMLAVDSQGYSAVENLNVNEDNLESAIYLLNVNPENLIKRKNAKRIFTVAIENDNYEIVKKLVYLESGQLNKALINRLYDNDLIKLMKIAGLNADEKVENYLQQKTQPQQFSVKKQWVESNLVQNNDLVDYFKKVNPNLLIEIDYENKLKRINNTLESEKTQLSIDEISDLLVFALEHDWHDYAKMLCDSYLDVNTQMGKMNQTSLMLAIEHGNADLCLYLLSKKPDLTVHDLKHKSVKDYIFSENVGYNLDMHNKLVNAYLDATNNLEDLKFDNNQTVLMWAINQGLNNTVIDKIISRMSIDEINQKDNNGFNALMHACNMRRFEVCERLLKMPGIVLEQTSYKGETALTIAVKRGMLNTASELIENSNLTDNVIQQILPNLINRESYLVTKIIDKADNDDDVHPIATSALKMAIDDGKYETAQSLVKKGVDVNALDSSGEPLISLLINNSSMLPGQKVFILKKIMVDKLSPATIAYQRPNNDNLLLWAIKNLNMFDDSKWVLELIQQMTPESLNNVDNEGNTALNLCFASPYFYWKDIYSELAVVLIEKGADVNIKNNKNLSPLTHILSYKDFNSNAKYIYKYCIYNLINAGMNLDESVKFETGKEHTLLTWAQDYEMSEDILLKIAQKMSAKNLILNANEEDSPVEKATRMGHTELAKYLVEATENAHKRKKSLQFSPNVTSVGESATIAQSIKKPSTPRK